MSTKNEGKKILLHLSLLFLYLILNAYCQASDCSTNCRNNGFACINKDSLICSQKCKPKFGGTANECYFCNFEGYYYIDNDGICTQSCPNEKEYIIDSSKECSSSDPPPSSAYKMEHVYYKTCPIYSKIKDGSGNECECENKFYIELINGKKIKHCLSPGSECPYGKSFHKFGENECIESCADTSTHLYSANNICYQASNCNFIRTTDYKCLSTCNVGEGFIFELEAPHKSNA